jgi:hypothetical protein
MGGFRHLPVPVMSDSKKQATKTRLVSQGWKLSNTGKIIIISRYMSLMRFMILATVGAVMSWIAWIAVVVRLNPLSGGMVAHGLFYASLFLALVGTFTIIGFFARRWFEKEDVPFRQVTVAARQSLLVSLAAIVGLALQAQRWMNLWIALLIIILAIGIESIFLTGQSRHRVSFES